MVSLYIEHLESHNWKETHLGIPKFSLFDIFLSASNVLFISIEPLMLK